MNSLKALPSDVELTIHGRALTSVDSAESWLLKNSATFSASSASSAPSRRHVHNRHTDTQTHRNTDSQTRTHLVSIISIIGIVRIIQKTLTHQTHRHTEIQTHRHAHTFSASSSSFGQTFLSSFPRILSMGHACTSAVPNCLYIIWIFISSSCSCTASLYYAW